MSRTRSRIAASVVSAFTSLALIAPLPAAAEPSPPPQAGWVGSWHAAMTGPARSGPSLDGFTDTTLRQVAHLSVGGDSVRVRLSNAYGQSPLVVGSVTVAPRPDSGAGTPDVDAGALVPVTFDGRTSVTVPAGADWVSDPVNVTVPDDSDLVVSLYLPGPTGPATFHSRGYATSFTAAGDATTDPGAAFTALDTSRYFLSGVDVTARAKGSVVFFGDSITDGVVSSVDANLRYPDQVADRLLERPDPQECGVLNSGISGNRLLTDAGSSGDSALSRFERDVVSRPGVRSVVLLEGINDIGGSRGAVEPEQLIAVYRQFIARAHDAGIEVVGATLTPFEGAGYYTEAGEADRQVVNEWIRTSGEFDAVVDLDAAVRDPEHPARFLPAYDIGDHLHPNDAGFAAMAEAIDLRTIC
ncbi:SGNH/GDSL hydrolase family protein [Saccharomonospora xinjiangensis]|uniref:SGNH/GDSL hydrolase family protein n=1 Tax=Saccharomonospora xinjiangensis TaxID=75294 RepID=UPI00106F3AB3|nr:SGNH/GDSL hydrolase family protein [Saccharomonospora xinjiangensis]QBQ59984.1 GDSL-like Lipase/Acylhydrolase [Saccharomonospora xinjiangensis]